MSPTKTSSYSTKNSPVQSLENSTIPLLPSTPAVITRSGRQSKPHPKLSDSAHSYFLAFISTLSPQQPQPFQHLLHPDVKSQSTPATMALSSAVGFLSYISTMIHPDITMLVQQCVRFCNNTRQ